VFGFAPFGRVAFASIPKTGLPALVYLDGQTLVITPGVLSPSGKATSPITGQELNIEQGALRFVSGYLLAGQTIASSLGDLSVLGKGTVALDSQTMQILTGDVHTAISVRLAGFQLYTSQQNVSVTGKGNVSLDNQTLASSLSGVTPQANATVRPTGIQANMAQGLVFVSGNANVRIAPIPLTAVISLTSPLVWGGIVPGPDGNWVNIDDSQAGTWTAVPLPMATGWVDVVDDQSGTWENVDDSQTPGWKDIVT